MVMTLEVSDTILKAAQGDFVMRCRLAGISDLVAADSKYHQQCRVEFTRRMEKPGLEDSISAREVCLTRLTEEIRAGVSSGNVYTLVDVWHRFEQLLSEFGEKAGIYRNCKTRFKQRLEKDLHGVIDFVPQLDSRSPQLLFPKASTKSAVPELKRKHDELVESLAMNDLAQYTPKTEETRSLLSMYHVAMSVRNEIRSTPGIENCMSISEEDAVKVVPENLYLFLRILLTGQECLSDEEEDVDNGNTRKKILSIAQDLVFMISNGRKLTPKHVGLGMTLHQATRSKDLVNLVHAAGHCIGYDQVRKIDTAIAKHTLDEFVANGNVPIPSSIRPDHFFQFSADNIDIIEETLDGKGTFHATQMVAFQRGTSHDSGLPMIVMGNKKSLDIPDSLHKLTAAPRTNSRPTPAFKNNIDITWYDSDANMDKDARLSDITWVATRLANVEDQKVPFWTGFNQIVSDVSSDLTTVGFLPILNSPAHENDTLWTVILRCLNISHKLNPGQATVLTLDEQLYCKAKELQWSSPDICSTLVLRLGGFHTALTFMRVIGKHFADSGLADVWVESSVFGENTAVNNLSAKSYNRAIRAHKLTYEALLRILWPQFVNWLSDRQSPLTQELIDKVKSLADMIAGREELDQVLEAYNAIKTMMLACNLTELMNEFQSTRSPTVQYWQQYIDMVSLLLRFTRAEREGNWPLHLSAFAAMLPWFAIYDHTNYTRWGAVYLADMRQLELTHPDVYLEFVSGNFVVKRTRKTFNQLPTDQALEHVNKVSKMAGGLVGITREDGARDRWCLTFNQRSQIVADTYELFGFQDRDAEYSVWEAKEGNPARLVRDESDVRQIMEQLSNFNTFRHEIPHLVSLSTRDVAPEDIAQALLNAERQGQKHLVDFVVHRLCAEPSTFHESLRKHKSPTLSTMYHVTVKGHSTEKSKDVKAGPSLLQRLLVAQEAGRGINLEALLCHELSKTPLSLTDSQGNLRHCNKADLGQILAAGITYETLPQSSLKTATIIDGQSLVQAIGRPNNANTFGDLADIYFGAVCSKLGTRVDVVFDRYFEESIKGETRNHRTGGSRNRPIRRIVENRDVPLPVNWKQFISLSENKVNLADFLSNQVMMSSQLLHGREIVTAGGFSDVMAAKSSTGRDVEMLNADHEEADTRIVLHAIEACQQGYERLIVSCRDTDVLVLLIYFSERLCKEVWMSTGTAKTPKFIAVHDVVLPDELRRSLPAYHAVTGCDTVSQFGGHGKRLTWKAYEKCPDLLEGLGVGSLTDETAASVEEFVCKLYSPNFGVNCVNSLRCKLFRKGNVEPEKLPPTRDALVQHVKRAHYQTKIWRLSSQPIQDLISPIGHGWERDTEAHILKPVLTTLDPLPKYCLEIITCGCTNCSTIRCGCRSKGLICTAACGFSDKVCHNPYNTGNND